MISHQFYLIVQQQFFIMIIRFSLHASIPNFNFSPHYRISQHFRLFSQHYRNLINANRFWCLGFSNCMVNNYWIYRVTFGQGSADFHSMIKISQHFQIASSTKIESLWESNIFFCVKTCKLRQILSLLVNNYYRQLETNRVCKLTGSIR